MTQAQEQMETATLPDLIPVSMRDAVGYDSIDCKHQKMVEEALTLKHDRIFLIINSHGDIVPPGRCALGMFQDDTRMLSHYALRTAGGEASLLSSRAERMYSAQIDLTVTDQEFGGIAWDPKNSVHIRREFVLGDHLTERVTLANYLTFPIDFWMELSVGCDFADIFEVRGWNRSERGQFYAPQVSDDSILFAYRGVDGKMIHSRIRFASGSPELYPDRARWTMRLEPNVPVTVEWDVLPDCRTEDDGAEAREQLHVRRNTLATVYDEWRSDCTQWVSDAEPFDAALDQAIVDLRGLYIESEGEPIISAGIPWYSTAFGRDSIIASLQTLCVNPLIAADTLRYLAHHQGKVENAYTEEQPGKIMHELRRGEMARSGEIPHVPYYGSIDATPLWLILLHEVWRWTGDEVLVREHLPNAESALRWIDEYGDLDGDGFVEYARTSDKGLVNQGWKDSGDGVPFPDGEIPEPPIALVEVQGYVYDARMRMASLYSAFGERERAESLRAQAKTLRKAIIDRFWMDELDTFAIALDGRKTPVPTITTNAGHLLWSRVPTQEQANRMAAGFSASSMFSGWGLRTLSAEHEVFNPMSYHDGSIWPHDNAIVAMGLTLNGHTRAALPVLSALHDAASGMRYSRLPELFCGMERAHAAVPVLYPVSCSPQAWASGALFMLLQGVTGILPDAPAGTLHIRDPHLPQCIRELTMLRLSIGGSRVSLHFSRTGTRTLANLLDVEGDPLKVRIELT